MTAKRIFITGGASGLGRATALRLARAGWKVAIGDLNDARGEETLRELGRDGMYSRCDVTREDDLLAVAKRLERAWGGVDVLMNNAGVAGAGAIEDFTLKDWQWIVDINLLGVVRGCRASMRTDDAGLRAAMDKHLNSTWRLKRLLPRATYLAAIGGQMRRLAAAASKTVVPPAGGPR